MVTTLRDVAAAAGVSAATVSRVLSGSTLVAATTRERVARIAAELDYLPNSAARQLVTGRPQVVGLVVPDLQNAFYACVAAGMQRRVRAAGLNAMIADTEEEPARELEALAQLSMVCDGSVLASARSSDRAIREAAERSRIVLVNRELAGVPAVVANNADGMRQAFEHLRFLGHTRIGYAGGPASSWSDARRRAGLPKVVDLGGFLPGQGGGAAAALSAIAAQVTAVLAFNDHLALGILAALAERGVQVPGQMSVVGFDDVPMARLLAPALTTVAVPALEMGAAAVDLLFTTQAPTTRTVDVTLQVRGSTAPPTP